LEDPQPGAQLLQLAPAQFVLVVFVLQFAFPLKQTVLPFVPSKSKLYALAKTTLKPPVSLPDSSCSIA